MVRFYCGVLKNRNEIAMAGLIFNEGHKESATQALVIQGSSNFTAHSAFYNTILCTSVNCIYSTLNISLQLFYIII